MSWLVRLLVVQIHHYRVVGVLNMKHYILIQFVGFVAVGVSLWVFQINNRHTMLKLMVLSALLYATHFYFLGAYTGAAMNLLGAGRNIVFIKSNNRTKWLPAGFIVLFVIATIITWQGPLSLLPLGGMIGGTLAFWQTNTSRIRRLALMSPPLWFTYNFISGSYPGMLIEVIMLSSNLIGTWRFDLRPAKHISKTKL